MHVPAIGVVTTARPVGLQADGAMEVPDFGDSGWYDEGPMPGARGPAVVVAHVSGPDGPDVFARLGELQAGDEVVVVTDSVTQQYRVTRTEVHPKDQLPNEEIWGATDQRELRLITCGGSWNASRRSYRDNIVVWAQPVGDA